MTNVNALCIPAKFQLTAKFQTILIPRHTGKDHAGVGLCLLLQEYMNGPIPAHTTKRKNISLQQILC
jgi:hypothetical protein